VKDFIVEGLREWNFPKLKETFDKFNVENIMKVPIPISVEPDCVIWVKEAKVDFLLSWLIRCPKKRSGVE